MPRWYESDKRLVTLVKKITRKRKSELCLHYVAPCFQSSQSVAARLGVDYYRKKRRDASQKKRRARSFVVKKHKKLKKKNRNKRLK